MPLTNEEIKPFFEKEKELVANWVDKNIAEGNISKDIKNNIRVIEELFNTEHTFVASMLKLKDILQEKVKLEVYTPTQKKTLRTYIKQIDSFLNAYHSLNFGGSVIQEGRSVNEVMNHLQKIIVEQPFQAYANKIKILVHADEDLKRVFLGDSNTLSEVSKLSSQPFQRLPRYSLLFGTFKPQLADDFLTQVSGFARSLNNEIAQKELALEQMQGKKDKEREDIALRNILQLNFNNPLNKVPEKMSESVEYYMSAILTEAYPNLFYLQNGQFEIQPSSNSVLINQAFGIEIRLDGSAPVKELKFDFSTLNKNALDALYKNDANPLWLVLKSTKPINEDFSASEKIAVYAELAQAFKDSKIGDTEKYLQAANLAQNAFAIALEHEECREQVNRTFGSASPLGTWMLEKYEEHKVALAERVALFKILSSYEKVLLNKESKYGFDFGEDKQKRKQINNAIKTLDLSKSKYFELREGENGFKIKKQYHGQQIDQKDLVSDLKTVLHALKNKNVDIHSLVLDKKTGPQEHNLFLQAKDAALLEIQKQSSLIAETTVVDSQRSEPSVSSSSSSGKGEGVDEPRVQEFDLEQQLADLSSQLKQKQDQLQEVQEQNQALNALLTEQDRLMGSKDQEVAQLKGNLDDEIKSKEGMIRQLNEAQVSFDVTQKKVEQLTQNLVEQTGLNAKMKQEVGKVNEELRTQAEEMEAIRASLNDLQRRNTELVAQVQQKEYALAQESKEKLELSVQNGTLKEALNAKDGEIEKLKEDDRAAKQLYSMSETAKHTHETSVMKLEHEKKEIQVFEQSKNKSFMILGELAQYISVQEKTDWEKRVDTIPPGDWDRLDEVKQELVDLKTKLAKVDSIIEEVKNKLIARGGSGLLEKKSAIENAYKNLSGDDKIKLLNLNDETIDKKIKAKSHEPIDKFLQAIGQSRSFFQLGEVKSVKNFKQQLEEVKQKIGKEDNVEIDSTFRDKPGSRL